MNCSRSVDFSHNHPRLQTEESFVNRQRYAGRLAALDERARHFLEIAAWLGGTSSTATAAPRSPRFTQG